MTQKTRRRRFSIIGVIAALGVSGCVVQPVAPPAPPPPPPNTNVYFYPLRGQGPQQQDRDRYECNGWAVRQSGFDPSLPNDPPHLHVMVENSGPPPGTGVAVGAVSGAVLGAAVSRPWEAGTGALFGAIAGAMVGGIAESAAGQQRQQMAANASANANAAAAAQLEQRANNYRRAMAACLDARGYQVR